MFAPDLEELLRSIREKSAGYKRRFLIQFAQKIRKVEIEEVVYFYALEEVIDPNMFFRINRNMIIAFKLDQNSSRLR